MDICSSNSHMERRSEEMLCFVLENDQEDNEGQSGDR
jgi:hypothetical protein